MDGSSYAYYMVLNRAARKEADTRLGQLRRSVSIHVFTHRFEDSLSREVRQLAEELAEVSSRVSVEISEATESGDLLRKFRLDTIPALVLTTKDAPEIRIYGLPLVYGFDLLLDLLISLGSLAEPKPELVSFLQSHSDRAPRAPVSIDLLVSRYQPASVEAAAVLWRLIKAEKAGFGTEHCIASIRITEDFPQWIHRTDASNLPCLHLESRETLSWPFSDELIAEKALFGHK